MTSLALKLDSERGFKKRLKDREHREEMNTQRYTNLNGYLKLSKYIRTNLRLNLLCIVFLILTAYCSLLTVPAQNQYQNRIISRVDITFEGADRELSAAEQFRLIVSGITGEKYSPVRIRESLQLLY